MTRPISWPVLQVVIALWILPACSQNGAPTRTDSATADTAPDSATADTALDSETVQDTAISTETESQTDSADACPAPAAQESGFLWFSGYEQSPWDAEWGLEWNQNTNHEVTSEGALFGNAVARVTYPEGVVSSEGGAQYRMDFSRLESPIAATNALYARYYIKFDENIDFVLGGKLPGLLGGMGNTGGDAPTGFDGWSARIMWRPSGRIVQYVYHPDQDGDYGEDMDWNEGGASRFFIPGKWHCVETYIQMNTVDGEGEAAARYDGVIRSWLDGELALERTDVRFRYTTDFAIDGFYFSTFFGGSEPDWAPVKTETAWFDNFAIDDERIGCQNPCVLPDAPAGQTPVLNVTQTTVVWNGDTPAWTPASWSTQGAVYDFANPENHTTAGNLGAYIRFATDAWDAVEFKSATAFNPGDYTHLRLWIRPEGKNVRFRAQFRGSANSADVVVDGSPTFHNDTWIPLQWQEIVIPISKFAAPDAENRVLIRSDTNTPTDGFWIDDVELIVAAAN